MTTAGTYGSSPVKRRRRTQEQIERLDAALYGIVSEEKPMTVRQVFYQAVSRGLVPKDEGKGYRVVQRRLKELRESRVMPYSWITDGSRTAYGRTRYNDLQEFAQQAATLYRRDYWSRAPRRVEVWLEKDALSGVLYPTVVDEWGLDLYITRGFASITYLQTAAEQIIDYGTPTTVYVLTDFDPSGVVIAEKVSEELRSRTGDIDVEVHRLAVDREQIERFNLQTRPTKRSDTRAKKFMREHGVGSVELDAIPSNQLRALVSEAISRHANTEEFERLKRNEELEKESIRQMTFGGGL